MVYAMSLVCSKEKWEYCEYIRKKEEKKQEEKKKEDKTCALESKFTLI